MSSPFPKRKTARQLQRQVALWNFQRAPGAAVRVLLDDGSTKETRTRGHAQVLGGHSAVIFLDGFSGCYSLDRVTAI